MIDTKLIGVAKSLKAKKDRLALGYERGLDFAYGYIESRVDAGDITRKQANVLFKCFASYDEEYDFDFKTGKAIERKEDE